MVPGRADTLQLLSHTITLFMKVIIEAIITTPSLQLKFSQNIANGVWGELDSESSQEM